MSNEKPNREDIKGFPKRKRISFGIEINHWDDRNETSKEYKVSFPDFEDINRILSIMIKCCKNKKDSCSNEASD
jgi:hypothetical protein